MICYVDMEHEQALQTEALRAAHDAYCKTVKRRLEETSGRTCLVRNYRRVTQAWLDAAGIEALVFSGNVTDWDRYAAADMHRITTIIRRAELPILGLCGGLQLIAIAHDVPVGPMRPLAPGEPDPNPDMGRGYFKEWGFLPVRVLKPDPLFDGLGEQPVFLCAHYAEVKEVPPGFELLASTDTCRVQVVRRKGELVYGTQFHPEAYTEDDTTGSNWLLDLVYPDGYPQGQTDGRTLLSNFFRICLPHRPPD